MDYIWIRFLRQSVLSFKALYGYLDIKSIVLFKIINPFFQFVFFTLLAKYMYNASDVTPWVISNAFILSANSAFFGVGFIMITERNYGTLKSVIASTTNKFMVFVGRAFLHIFEASLSVVLGLLCGFIFFQMNYQNTNYMLLLLCILISMFSSMGFGLLIGSLGVVVTDLNFIMNFALYILLLFSGALIPLDSFPEIVGKMCNILPLTNGIEASRMIAMGSNSIQILKLILMEFFKGVLFFSAGYYTLYYFEKKAKYRGTLDL